MGWVALPSFFTLPSSIGVVGVVGVVETALGEAPEMSDRAAPATALGRGTGETEMQKACKRKGIRETQENKDYDQGQG